jgi:sugar phosphate permease
MTARIIVFAVFACAYFLSNFFRATNAVIADDLSRELLLTAADLGFMTSLFYVGFAAMQLPIGAALDRIGPRVTSASLMLVAVGGALVFAMADSFFAVALGRTLIGIGMGSGLMSAIKTFGVWFRPERQATITSIMVGLGASGGLLAATPLAWVNAQIGWRSVFAWGAAAIALSALAILLLARNAPPGAPDPMRAAGAPPDGGFARIFRQPILWRLVPFLFDVLRLTPLAVGNLLLALSGGIAGGYLTSGYLSDRFGIERMVVIVSPAAAMALAVLAWWGAQLPQALVGVLFAIFGYAGAFNLVLLAQIRREFPEQLRGRAATALNMFGFGGAALLQWWMGVIVAFFPRDAAGHYPPSAYTAAFGFVAIGLMLSVLWYLRRAPHATAIPPVTS